MKLSEPFFYSAAALYDTIRKLQDDLHIMELDYQADVERLEKKCAQLQRDLDIAYQENARLKR